MKYVVARTVALSIVTLTLFGHSSIGAASDVQENCWDCKACFLQDAHKLPNTKPAFIGYTGAHNWCIEPSTSCDGYHNTCEAGGMLPSSDAVREFWAAMRVSNGDLIADLLNRYSDVAYLNADRRSVQVTGCNGALIANLPLTGELLRSVHLGD